MKYLFQTLIIIFSIIYFSDTEGMKLHRDSQPVTSTDDCKLTERGENYRGKRQHVLIGGKWQACFPWTMSNWRYMLIINKQKKLPQIKNFNLINEVVENWLRYHNDIGDNYCRNPGGVFDDPVCISGSEEHGKLLSCNVPMCTKQNCSINLSGQLYSTYSCPSYEKFFPSQDKKCICRYSRNGSFYKGKLSSGKYEDIPCEINDCESKRNSFLVSQGLFGDHLWNIPQFEQHFEIALRGFSSLEQNIALLQMRVNPDQADSGINIGLTQNHFHRNQKAFLAVVGIGNIPIFSNSIALLSRKFRKTQNFVSVAKHWPGVYHSDSWSQISVFIKHGKVMVSNKNIYEKSGRIKFKLPIELLTGVPKWFRLVSDGIVESSFDTNTQTSCPILLTLPKNRETNQQNYHWGQFTMSTVSSIVQKLRESNEYKLITNQDKINKKQNTNYFFKVRGQFPSMYIDFYVKGHLKNDASVIFGRYPNDKQSLRIYLNNNLKICQQTDRGCYNLKEWEVNKDQTERNVTALTEPLYFEYKWTRFIIRITHNRIQIFRELQSSTSKHNGGIKPLYNFIIKSIDLLPQKFVTFEGNLHRWAVDCIPEDLDEKLKPPICSPKKPAGKSVGKNYQGNIFYGLNKENEYELCRSWSYENNPYSYLTNKDRVLGNYESVNFKGSAIPTHNFCRSIIRKRSLNPICIGIQSNNVLQCETECKGNNIRRYTLFGAEFNQNVSVTKTGRKCLFNKSCQFQNMFGGISCPVLTSNAGLLPANIKSNFVYDRCEVHIQSISHKSDYYGQMDVTDRHLEYLDLESNRQGITFGLMPASVASSSGLALVFFDKLLNEVACLILGLRNYQINFKVWTQNGATEYQFTKDLEVQIFQDMEMKYFQIQFSKQLWTIVEIQNKGSQLSSNVLWQIKTEKIKSLMGINFLAFELNRSPWSGRRSRNFRERIKSYTKYHKLRNLQWYRMNLKQLACPNITLDDIYQSYQRKLPFQEKDFYSIHFESTETNSMMIKFKKSLFTNKSKSQFENQWQKQIKISPKQGKIQMKFSHNFDFSSMDAVENFENYQAMEQTIQTKEKITAVNFGFLKLSPQMWLEMALTLCPNKYNAKVIEQNLKKRKNINKNEYLKYLLIQSLVGNKISNQSLEDVNPETLPHSGQFMSFQGKKFIQRNRKQQYEVKFYEELHSGMVMAFSKIKNEKQLEGSLNNTEQKRRNFETLVEYKLLKELLGVKHQSINSIDKQCRPPLWLNQWVLIVRTKTTKDRFFRPVTVIKTNLESPESMIFGNYWTMLTEDKKVTVTLQNNKCQLKRQQLQNNSNENGVWRKTKQYCSKDCGTGHGFDQWQCLNISVNGNLCKNDNKYMFSYQQQKICNRFPCGALDQRLERKINHAAKFEILQYYKQEGEKVKVSCVSNALVEIHNDKRFQSKMQLFWYKGDREYKHGEEITKIGGLKFPVSKPDQSGLYQCLLIFKISDNSQVQTSLSQSSTRIYLAAVRGLVVVSQSATHNVLLSKPFIFKIEAQAFCSAKYYQCRTTLVHLRGNQRVIIKDSPIIKNNFTILDVQESQLGQYIICIQRYNSTNQTEKMQILSIKPDDLLCIQYFHLKESIWLKHLNIFISWIEHHPIGKIIKKNPSAFAVFILCMLLLWFSTFMCLSSLSAMDNIAKSDNAQKQARQRLLLMGHGYRLTPYEELILDRERRDQKQSKAIIVFWKFIRLFTKQFEQDLSDKLDEGDRGLNILDQKDLSSSNLFLTSISSKQVSMFSSSSHKEDDMRLLPPPCSPDSTKRGSI